MSIGNVSALLLVFVLSAPVQQQDQQSLQLGKLTWEGTPGSALLQLNPALRQVQVAVGLTNIVRVNGQLTETVKFPSGEITAWVLLENGSSLRHMGTTPEPGKRASGAGNAGGGASWAFLTFESPTMAVPAAVVVRIRKELYIFPVVAVK